MPLPDPATLPGASAKGELVEIAYAKVNIALHVRERRADGYHALESLFAFARHGDLLTGQERDDGAISLTLDGPFAVSLEAGPDNLVVRAARALQDYLVERRGAALSLTKNLPIASGIGGGSADAAATLRLLDRLWDARLPAAEMERIALTMGSDIPACVSSVTQMVRGRGEVLERREIDGLAGRPMLLVNPGVALSTARVFAGWDQVDHGPLAAHDLDGLIAEGRNDLEGSAIAQAPVISDVLAQLGERDGVLLARMSGSGATCFALFNSEMAMRAAVEHLRCDQPHWWIMETEIRAA